MRPRKEVEKDITKLKQDIADLEHECPELTYVELVKNERMTQQGEGKEERGHRLDFGMSDLVVYSVTLPVQATKEVLIDRLAQMILTITGEKDETNKD